MNGSIRMVRPGTRRERLKGLCMTLCLMLIWVHGIAPVFAMSDGHGEYGHVDPHHDGKVEADSTDGCSPSGQDSRCCGLCSMAIPAEASAGTDWRDIWNRLGFLRLPYFVPERTFHPPRPF